MLNRHRTALLPTITYSVCLQGREQEITLSDLSHVAEEEQNAWFDEADSRQVSHCLQHRPEAPSAFECATCELSPLGPLRSLHFFGIHSYESTGYQCLSLCVLILSLETDSARGFQVISQYL